MNDTDSGTDRGTDTASGARIVPMRRAQRRPAVEARGLLLGAAAHELNNIFAQTLLLAEVLGTTDLDADLKTMLGSLQGSVQRGIRVVNRLVEQNTSAEGSRLRLDPRHLISAVHKRSEGLVGEQVQLSHRYPEDVADIEAEPQLLLDTLLDLCQVTARQQLEVGESARIEVTVSVEDRSGDCRVFLGATAPPALLASGRLQRSAYLERRDASAMTSADFLDRFCGAAEQLGARACTRRDGRGSQLALAFVAAD